MKKLFTSLFFVALFFCAMAQAPQKFSYQAVVRNSSNALVINQNVSARISILQGSFAGNAVYVETHFETTNENGLLILEIGDGTVQQGSFSNIDWANGPYFLKSEIDPDGGNNYDITSVQQLLSVPYSLFAQHAANGFSGDYNDLTNLPQIPAIPQNVSAFNNDVPYLTAEQQILSISNDTIFLTGGSFVKLPKTFSGNYNDLTNLPQIPTVPQNVSAFNNDVPYLTAEQQILSISNDTIFLTGGSFVKLPKSFSGDYNDLTNRPQIPIVPQNVSAFNNDAGYITNENCPQTNLCDLYNLISDLQNRVNMLEQNQGNYQNNNNQNSNNQSVNQSIANPCDSIGLVNDIDGNVYNTVQIGAQCWTKENIRTTRYADGTVIPMGENTSNNVAYRYAPGNFMSNVSQLGYLYNWTAVMHGATDDATQVQGVCPNGWHVPSDAEWKTMTDYVSAHAQYVCGGNNSMIAKSLAADNTWYNNSGACDVGNNVSDNNGTDFSALPAGYYFGSYYNINKTAYFWTSTPVGGSYAKGREMSSYSGEVGDNKYFKYNAFSVR